MRGIRYALYGMLFLALVLLLGSSLVEGPPQATLPEAARCVGETALLPGTAAAPEAGTDRAPERRQMTARAMAVALPAAEPAVEICRDRQGLPLGQRPWYRAAWGACPPEGRFG